MDGLLEKVVFLLIVAFLAFWIKIVFERLRAWNSYDLVKCELERNLLVLRQMYEKVSNIHGKNPTEKQKQINDMLNAAPNVLPINLSNLVAQQIPRWSYKAWESQISLLAQILSAQQIKGIYELQVLLENISILHAKASHLVANYKDAAREPAMKIWTEWEDYVKRALESGNPLIEVTLPHKLMDIIFGLGRIIKI